MRTLQAPPDSVIDPATRALRSGSYRGHLPRVDLAPLGKGALFRVTHHKKWIYVAIASEELLVCVAVAHIGYLANSFVFALDLDQRGLLVDRSSLGPPGIARVGSSALETRVASYKLGKHRVSVERAGSAYQLEVTVRDLSLSARLDASAAPAPIGIIAPVPGGIVNATEKGVLLDVKGHAEVRGRRYDLDGALAGYDYTNGYLARHTAWKWAFALGRAKDGRRVAFNLVEGFIGERECAVWIDGELYPVGEGRFSFDPKNPLGPWRLTTADGAVDLEFAPGGLHAEHKNFGIVASKFVQPSGLYKGTIKIPGVPDVVVDRLAGVAEDQDILW